jgi:hypothetical protein
MECSPEQTELIAALKKGVEVKDRRSGLKANKRTFVGKEMVAWLLSSHRASKVDAAVTLGNEIRELGFFAHVRTAGKLFENSKDLYRCVFFPPRWGQLGAPGYPTAHTLPPSQVLYLRMSLLPLGRRREAPKILTHASLPTSL